MNPINYARGIVAFIRIVRDPNRLNEVFEMSDAMVEPEVERRMADAIAQHPEGARALIERERLGAVEMDQLATLPTGTFGREFADHMRRNGLDLAAIPNLPSTNAYEFMRAHLYETHDIWHVVTGFGTDVAGEGGLQAFYAAQLDGGLPFAILAALMLNSITMPFGERQRRMRDVARGYLLGRRAQPLFGTNWQKLWNVPLAELRARLGLDLDAVDRILPVEELPLRAAA